MVYIRSRAQRAFFDALHAYQKAYQRFSKAQPTQAESEQAFDAALDELLEALKSDEVCDALNACLQSTECEGDPQEDIALKLLGDSQDARFERALASNFGMSKRAVKRIAKFFDAENSPSGALTHASIAETINAAHQNAKSKINASRKLSRKAKKVRKRDIKRGLYSATFGSGILIANTVSGPSFLFSYGIACVALHQAGRDIIGDIQ